MSGRDGGQGRHSNQKGNEHDRSVPADGCLAVTGSVDSVAAALVPVEWSGAARARARLMAAFEAHRAQHRGSSLGAGGSWAGPKTLFDDFERQTRSLRDWIMSLLPGDQAWRISAWGVLHLPGDALIEHDHVRSHRGGKNVWAGVYWLSGGVAADAFCWRSGGDVGRTAPVVGSAVVFPADMPHWTEAATEERRAIAFNVDVDVP